ncbi:hypothetical protein [Chondromyces crocatus]|uniref:Uncharacterized protein n=1 Tax=Chondromyces crocatus TaxID=52 RepID=A0A0K1ELR0_CHOCO|nr:hypothetical protein [Chondromyces crocatus]AKT41804.1 uncharacterized protein CMC5_060150 [Chondromyces crocatus]
MVDGADVEALAARLFPFVEGRWTLDVSRRGDGRPSADGICIEGSELLLVVHLSEGGEEGSPRKVREVMVTYDIAGVSRERWEAYVEGWKRAFPSLIARAAAARHPELFGAIGCAQVLREATLVTADDFARGMQAPSTLEASRQLAFPDRPPTEAEYEAYLEIARPERREDVVRRRDEAYERAMARHPAVAERLAATHGFVLPKQVALTWAFFSSLSRQEWQALFLMDLEPGRLCGVLDLFREGWLELPLVEGFDARMHGVRCDDPPELLLMVQDSQDRYGLFYDDPARMPSGVVRSPRHGQDEWWAETYLDGLRRRLEAALRYPAHSFAEEMKQGVCDARLIVEALDDFQERVERIRAEDRAGMLHPYEERLGMANTACGVGPVTPLGDAGEFEFAAERGDYQVARGDLQAPIAGWIASAREALAQGDPRHALALGRDLHASCWATEYALWQAEALALMVEAYQALGREALARRVEVHHASRHQQQRSGYCNPPDVQVGFRALG